jgi:sensor histidine kinase YesM
MILCLLLLLLGLSSQPVVIPHDKGEEVFVLNRSQSPSILIAMDTLSGEVYFRDTTGLGYRKAGRPFPDFPNISRIPVRDHAVLLRQGRSGNTTFLPQWWSREQALDFIYSHKKQTELQVLINTLSIGILTFLLLYFLLYSLVTRQRLYYYYIAYIFFAWLFCLSMPNELPLPAKQWLTRWGIDQDIDETAMAWMFFCYIAFSDELLGISKQSKALRYLFYFYYVSLGLYGAFQLFVGLFDLQFSFLGSIYAGFRLLFLPMYVVVLGLIIAQIRSPLKTYLLVANSFLLLGAVTAVLVHYSSIYYFFGPYKIVHATFLQMGIAAETTCFAFALGYHNSLIRKQRDERVKQQLEMENRMDKLTLQALDTQMNPHFLFNGINAVRDLMMKNEKEAAKDYLNTLALLLRSSLLNSKRERVLLEEELKYIDLYLTIEKLRLGKEFHYEIEVSGGLDAGEVELPGNLLHPVVENAVKHGLRWEEVVVKRLRISAKAVDAATWALRVEDNGVGRAKSEAYKRLDPFQSTGLGLQLVREKVKLHREVLDFEIIDKEQGTEVRFLFSK